MSYMCNIVEMGRVWWCVEEDREVIWTPLSTVLQHQIINLYILTTESFGAWEAIFLVKFFICFTFSKIHSHQHQRHQKE